MGNDVRVEAGPASSAKAFFTGEVVAVEPVTDGPDPRVMIRALNRLHRLTRERKVLVAFEHGDLSRPVIVGSLWNRDDRCRGDRPDER